MKHLFCFGLGYTAAVVAARLAQKGWAVSGTATGPDKTKTLTDKGWKGLVFDGRSKSAEVTEALGRSTHVLLSIPPGAGGDPAHDVYAEEIAAAPSLAWIGYFSTIGVYGDAGGGWVDETTTPRPGSERGQRRVAAENAWTNLGDEHGKAVVIFRLPGIYGPDRNSLDDIKAGKARRIIKPDQFFNRAHVEDIASAVEAALSLKSSRIFNVTDDLPAPPQDVIAYGAELLGLPCPPAIAYDDAALSPMGRSFYSESKKVSNARMKSELGVSLKYPTYIEGLQALANHVPQTF